MPVRVFNQPSAKILEVSVFENGPHSWEWQTHTGDCVHFGGFAISRIAARFAGYDAMFQLLASGHHDT
jgi:hypothetical protein